MCLTCAKHTRTGRLPSVVRTGGRNVSLHHMTTAPTTVGCSLCGGSHHSSIHAGGHAKKLSNIKGLAHNYPGDIVKKAAHGKGRGIRLGR
jgi:hypothetical protein